MNCIYPKIRASVIRIARLSSQGPYRSRVTINKRSNLWKRTPNYSGLSEMGKISIDGRLSLLCQCETVCYVSLAFQFRWFWVYIEMLLWSLCLSLLRLCNCGQCVPSWPVSVIVIRDQCVSSWPVCHRDQCVPSWPVYVIVTSVCHRDQCCHRNQCVSSWPVFVVAADLYRGLSINVYQWWNNQSRDHWIQRCISWAAGVMNRGRSITIFILRELIFIYHSADGSSKIRVSSLPIGNFIAKG